MTELVNLPIETLPRHWEPARVGFVGMHQITHFKEAVVDHVIDGDSVWLFIDLDFDGITAHRNSRLLGIDAPDYEDPEGRAASRDWLMSQIKPGDHILVYVPDIDKYGRPLVGIYLDDEDTSLNEQSIQAGMSVPYDGGPRGEDEAGRQGTGER